jgi:hypothetical protein
MKYLLIVLLILISSCGFYNPRYSYDEIQYLDEISREIIENPDSTFYIINSYDILYEKTMVQELSHYDLDSIKKYFHDNNYQLCKHSFHRIKAPLYYDYTLYNIYGYLIYNVIGTNHYLKFKIVQMRKEFKHAIYRISYKNQKKCKVWEDDEQPIFWGDTE